MSEKKNSDIIKQEAQVEKNSTFEEFNENTLRVRRNLLIFSVITLVICCCMRYKYKKKINTGAKNAKLKVSFIQ